MHYKTMSQWLRRRWIMVRLPILCSLTLAVGVCIGAWPVSSAWLLPTCCCRSTATPRWITTSPRPHRPSRSTEITPLQRKASVARIKDSRNDIVLLGSLADTTNTAEPQQATTSSNSGYYFGTERPQERIQDSTSSTTTTNTVVDSSTSTTNTAAPNTSTTAPFPVRRGPDPATKPNYEEIVGPLGRTVDQWLLQLFRSKLAARVGWDSSRNATDYSAVPELALRLTQQFPHNPTQVQERSRQVLLDLFPSWLPPSYAVLFSRPFPQFAARMNAWATWVAGTWLMGKCEIHDLVVVVENDNDSTTRSNNNNAPSTTSTTVLRGQGLLVERCRFLEEAGCASVCVHACQIPTQTFFQQHMGLSLRMEPNYDTFECQFSFGLPATDTTNALARATPCLARCPASQSLRQNHPASGNTKRTLTNVAGVAASTSTTTTTVAFHSNAGNVEVREIPCAMMGDTE